MLGDLLLLVGAAGGGGGVGGGDLVLDGTVGAGTGDQLAGADVFVGAPLEVVRLADVDDLAPVVTDAVLPGAGGGPGTGPGAGIVLGGTAGLVDGHVRLLSQGFRLGAWGMDGRLPLSARWEARHLGQQVANFPAVGLKGMGLPQREQLR